MKILKITIIAATMLAAPVTAQQMSGTDHRRMEEAAAALGEGGTPGERIANYRTIQSILAAQGETGGAALMGHSASNIELQTGLSDALNAWANGAPDPMSDRAIASYVRKVTEIAQARYESGTMTLAAAANLYDSISALDTTMRKAKIGKVSDLISSATGDPKDGKRFMDSLSWMKAAKVAVDTLGDFENAKREDVTKLAALYVSKMSGGVGKLMQNPATHLAIDNVVWTREMFQASTEGMNIVADAIRTGHFDHERYAAVVATIQSLAKGPWDAGTAKRYLKELCKEITLLDGWCNDLFDAGDALLTAQDCEALTCDCGNLGGGMIAVLKKESCLIAQSNMQMACKADPANIQICDPGAKGPLASR